MLEEAIPRVNKTKDLGVTIEDNFSFNSHINEVVKSALKILGFIKRKSFNYKQPETVMILYKTLVRSKLDYASIIWNPQFKDKINKIERVQRKFIKFYCFKFGIRYERTNYKAVCDSLNLQTLEERRMFLDLTFLHKLTNNEIDCSGLIQNLTFRIPSKITRNKKSFYVAPYKINIRGNSPLVRITKSMNKLINANEMIDLAMPHGVFRKTIWSSLKKLCML